MLNIHDVIFLRKGYENVPRKVGRGFTKQKPHDAYGNSMIALLQSNTSPEPVYITSRWNHGSTIDNTQGTEADHAYTKEEFLNVIGADESILQRCYDQWKAETKAKKTQNASRKELNASKVTALRKFKYAQMLINNGMDMNSIHSEELISNLWCFYGNVEKFKGVYWATVVVGNDRYSTLMDGKKLLFDDVFIKSSYYYNRDARMIDREASPYILIGDAYSRGASPKMIYNIKRHKFLEIDGIKKFKYISDAFKYNFSTSETAFVAASPNQLAVIDFRTLNVISPDGRKKWFESIVNANSWRDSNMNYGRFSFHRINKTNDDTLLKLVYDSSAREYYFLDTETNKFVHNIEDSDYSPSSKQAFANKFLRYDNLNNPEWIKLQDLKTEQFLSINGETVFGRDSFLLNYKILVLKLLNTNTFILYDTDTQEFLRFNGDVLELQPDEAIHHLAFIHNFLKVPLQRFSGYVVLTLLYNLKNKTFYGDNISGTKFYMTVGEFAFPPEVVHEYGIAYLHELARDRWSRREEFDKLTYNVIRKRTEEGVTESKRNEFNAILERINRAKILN